MPLICTDCRREMLAVLPNFEVHDTEFNAGKYRTGTLYRCAECRTEIVICDGPELEWTTRTGPSESGGLILRCGPVEKQKQRAEDARRELAAWMKRRKHLEEFFARISSEPCTFRTCEDYCTHICSLAATAMRGEESNEWHDGKVVAILNESLVQDAARVFAEARQKHEACYGLKGSEGLQAESRAKEASKRLDGLEQALGRQIVEQYLKSKEEK